MGALAAMAGKVGTVYNENVLNVLGPTQQLEDMLTEVAAEELVELKRRERSYRAGRPPAPLAGCLVVLVDDGVATGSTMRAAIAAVRSQNPLRIVVAVPVAVSDTCREKETLVDEVVCLWIPKQFRSVAQAYQNFDQTSDEEVRKILDAARTANGDDDHG